MTLVHADEPPLVISRWHPIAWTETLAQCGRSWAMARIHKVSGTCGDQLLDHPLCTGEGRGRGGAATARTVNQGLFARLWPHMRAPGGASGRPRTLRRRCSTVKAVVGPAQAVAAADRPTGRAGCGPGQGAVCRGPVPRTRRSGPARGRRLEGRVGVAGPLACFNDRAYADPARYAPDFVGPHCRE